LSAVIFYGIWARRSRQPGHFQFTAHVRWADTSVSKARKAMPVGPQWVCFVWGLGSVVSSLALSGEQSRPVRNCVHFHALRL